MEVSYKESMGVTRDGGKINSAGKCSRWSRYMRFSGAGLIICV